MSTFGKDLIRSLREALAHAKGEGPAIANPPVTQREVRKQAKVIQDQMAPHADAGGDRDRVGG